ncbi:PET112 family, N terminal region domain containing protein, putative [Babesia bigemina]|uniref:PET112 family, N terminal region domain containing protein, putative n=1 Tax=Babesia bigemina TaxID=5866 RepID=A0A061D6D1_BABBI|nr:PET112 family, N terminal region domain containing protein, putative [Babesia bigemina]CDR96113.1 PET112 family, N terminal region domain containing protein, putative [Babesia bigemina]|eukprot:XP_012768299.1 PET112 family, N terminal region domain containing protein, putative [Babesia bigemina]
MVAILHSLAAVTYVLIYVGVSFGVAVSGFSVISTASLLLSYPHASTFFGRRPASNTNHRARSVSSALSRGFFVLFGQEATSGCVSPAHHGDVRFVAGVEAHIQLALPHKIFCDCPSIASCTSGQAECGTSAVNHEDNAGATVADCLPCDDLYERLNSILATPGSDKSECDSNVPYFKNDCMISFDDYASMYNNRRKARRAAEYGCRPSAVDRNSIHDLSKFKCAVCMGEVGALPLLSPLAILYGLSACNTFSCEPSSSVSFERKVYSYADLPKRYQLTQVSNPIGTNGRVLLSSGREIRIARVHLEEDTARTLTMGDGSSLHDYNRSGVGLLEVVTEACEMTVEELVECCSKIYELSVRGGLSKGLMHEGNIRFDVNISLPSRGPNRYELKNLNSFRRIRRSVLQCLSSGCLSQPASGTGRMDSEKAQDKVNRPNAWVDVMQHVLEDEPVPDAAATVGSTLGWSHASKDVEYQREKSASALYLNAPDTNIPTISISSELFSRVTAVAPSDYRPSLESLHDAYPSVPLDLLRVIQKSDAHIGLFRQMCDAIGDHPFVAKWLVNYVIPVVDVSSVDVDQLCELLNGVYSKRLNLDTAKRILRDYLSSGMHLEEYMQCHELGLLDEPATREFVQNYMASHSAGHTTATMDRKSLIRLVSDIVAASGHRLNYAMVRDLLAPPPVSS